MPGVIDAPPRKTHPDKSAARAAAWAAVAPRLAATLLGYIEQMRLSLRAATIVSLEGASARVRRVACPRGARGRARSR